VVNAHHLAQNAPPPEDLHEGDGQRGGEIKGTFEVRVARLTSQGMNLSMLKVFFYYSLNLPPFTFLPSFLPFAN
jgi:hypothetical protein